MDFDKEKAEEMVLALLYLTTFEDHSTLRAWKGHDWNILNGLHAKGYIDDPVSKAKSVALTDAGAKLSEQLFKKHFAPPH
jgi:hypothetical protein